jgi:hypothetical protein
VDRSKENAAKASFVERTGWLFQVPTIYYDRVWYSWLKQPPRLRRKETGPFSLWRSHPSFARRGICLDHESGFLIWTALPPQHFTFCYFCPSPRGLWPHKRTHRPGSNRVVHHMCRMGFSAS